jgi:hypothetical protein
MGLSEWAYMDRHIASLFAMTKSQSDPEKIHHPIGFPAFAVIG